jgi:hypothetical protein
MNDNRSDGLFDKESSDVVQFIYEVLFRNPLSLTARLPMKRAKTRCRFDALHAVVIFKGQCTFQQWMDTFAYMQRWRLYWSRFAQTAEEREEYRRAYEHNVGVWDRTHLMMGRRLH